MAAGDKEFRQSKNDKKIGLPPPSHTHAEKEHKSNLDDKKMIWKVETKW